MNGGGLTPVRLMQQDLSPEDQTINLRSENLRSGEPKEFLFKPSHGDPIFSNFQFFSEFFGFFSIFFSIFSFFDFFDSFIFFRNLN